MLQAQNITCRRGGGIVFRDTGFTVESGMVLIVTGANGSGKSSLLRITAGLLEPASGIISFNGADIAADPAAHRARLHYIGHLDAAKTGLTVVETLNYWRALRGGAGAADNVSSLEAFGLGKLKDRAVRGLSAGQKRRLTLTRLVLHPAALWLLDEPTTALDSAGQEMLYAQIARHGASGGITVIATHENLNLPYAQRLQIEGAR